MNDGRTITLSVHDATNVYFRACGAPPADAEDERGSLLRLSALLDAAYAAYDEESARARTAWARTWIDEPDHLVQLRDERHVLDDEPPEAADDERGRDWVGEYGPPEGDDLEEEDNERARAWVEEHGWPEEYDTEEPRR